MEATNEIIENKSVIPNDINDFIDNFEKSMIEDAVGSGEYELLDLPLKHIFTPGLYAREITMYKGNWITSKIHLTEHQFIISKGKVAVFNNGEEEILEAPYHGITKAGTRRILYIIEECIWTTFHANPDNENEIQIEDRIIEKHDNKLLSSPQNKIQ